MFFNKKTNRFSVWFFLFVGLINNIFAEQIIKSEQQNLFQIIAKENLKSLTTVGDQENDGLCSSISNIEEQGFKKVFEAKFKSQLNLPVDVRRRLIFTLLSQYEDANPVLQTTVLDEKSWQDLELLCGPKSLPSFYLASQIDRAVTEVGRANLYRKIVQPIVNQQQLENQQAVVRELVNNKALFNELNTKLSELVTPENMLLSFWDTEDWFSLIIQQSKIKLPFDTKISSINKIAKWLNTSPVTLEMRDRGRRVFGTVADILSIYGICALPFYALTGKSIIPGLPAEDFAKVAPFSMFGVACWLMNKVASKPVAQKGNAFFATCEYAERAYWSFREFGEGHVIRKYFHAKMAHIATYINNLKTMAGVVASNEILVAKLPAVMELNQFLQKLSKNSKEMQFLLGLLEKGTFKKDNNSYFTSFGRIETAFRFMIDLKEHFVKAMLAVGELDAQLSIAKLYKEFKDRRVTFCFPKYLTDNEPLAPSIKVTDFWNPFIAVDKVVPSSLTLGQPYDQPQNVIITGPNAGGKSTITKALIINIILAQSLGIAPAQELIFTPFNKIITYLNITDDIAAGNSHFKAGVLRARDVMDISEKLEENEFCLIGIDEVFNGTTHKEGQAAAYGLIKQLGSNRRNMCITNTHFELIPTLEVTTGQFVNYKVSVIESSNAKIQYPFKLEQGVSNQIITLKILKEEGFSDMFLEEAQRVLDSVYEYDLRHKK